MNVEKFNALVERRMADCRAVLCRKADEYVTDQDRLSNFKAALTVIGCKTPEKALWAFVSKHIVALRDFIDRLEAGEEVPKEWWLEKTGDITNYMFLLEALLEDRKAVKFAPEPMQMYEEGRD
jgi:hypothetical protein